MAYSASDDLTHPGDARALADLRLLGPDPENWVPQREGVDHDVVVVGGGQTGCAFAFALRRAGMGRVTVIDKAVDARRAGVWLNYARMNTLRTVKTLPGPDMGIPGLGFRSWYEAAHGEDAYERINRIPRTVWAEYLAWYRRILRIDVRYATELTRVEPAGSLFRLHLRKHGADRIETARKVILANGVGGGGGPNVPESVARHLPRDAYAHTCEAIDFDLLRGGTVAVVGAAASAFDAAATALEHGAEAVHMFVRRQRLASEPVSHARRYPGAFDNYAALPDADKWQHALRFVGAGSTPPADSIRRATQFPNFHLHLGTPWGASSFADGKIRVVAEGQEFLFDRLLLGTGYTSDIGLRPELADFVSDVALWRDRFAPAADPANRILGAFPYLGRAHEFLEKEPGAAPFLRNIHSFNPSAWISFGLPTGDIQSIPRDVPVIVRRISEDLFLDDLDLHRQRMGRGQKADFDESLYDRARWRRTGLVSAK